MGKLCKLYIFGTMSVLVFLSSYFFHISFWCFSWLIICKLFVFFLSAQLFCCCILLSSGQGPPNWFRHKSAFVAISSSSSCILTKYRIDHGHFNFRWERPFVSKSNASITGTHFDAHTLTHSEQSFRPIYYLILFDFRKHPYKFGGQWGAELSSNQALERHPPNNRFCYCYCCRCCCCSYEFYFFLHRTA